jgi:hypothetical protein
MRSTILVLGVALSMLACGGSDTTAPPPTVNGTWLASGAGASISLTLADVGGIVSGSGQLVEAATYPLSITGSDVGATFNLAITSPGQRSPTFIGTVNATTMSGMYTTSGFTGQTVVFTKQ